jgi:hypothetical protein
MRLAGEACGVRGVRQDGGGNRSGQVKDTPAFAQAFTEVIDDDGNRRPRGLRRRGDGASRRQQDHQAAPESRTHQMCRLQ